MGLIRGDKLGKLNLYASGEVLVYNMEFRPSMSTHSQCSVSDHTLKPGISNCAQ